MYKKTIWRKINEVNNRLEYSKDDFIAYFQAKSYLKKDIEIVYNEIINSTKIHGGMLYPEDDLLAFLDSVNEAEIDLLDNIFEKIFGVFISQKTINKIKNTHKAYDFKMILKGIEIKRKDIYHIIQAKYEQSKHFSEISIDEKLLSQILHELYPKDGFDCLVPTFSSWRWDNKEQKFILKTVENNQRKLIPILMCPDDLDLWCRVVVVEVEETKEYIHWLRIGVDISKAEILPSSVASSVQWFEKIPSYTFKKSEYDGFLAEFRKQIDF